MARAMWTGSISFGLVNVPIRLVTAVHPKTISFNMLSKDGRCRLRRKLYCPETGEEFEFNETGRGFEVAPDQYVLVKDEELDALKPEAARTVDITDFVDLADIDPLYYDRTYYLVPGEAGGKAYQLLVRAMEESGKVGIATFVMRQKQYLAALRPVQGVLMLHTMHFADEVTLPSELDSDVPKKAAVSDKEVAVAHRLIDALAGPFEPKKYRDEYREAVESLIEAKRHGEEIVTAASEEEPEPRVINLMEALERSLKEAGKTSGGKRKSTETKSAGRSKSAGKSKSPRKKSA